MMDVPPPSLCYLCRMQRRLSYRNERYLYHRTCALTGKAIISSFSEEKPFPVFDLDAWWSDKWDPLSYGQEFDFNRPFFDQFFELRDRVPRLCLQQQQPMENSPYCNCASMNKNCYLVFSTNHCEDCEYGSWVNYSRDCVDNTNIYSCELCYECTGCENCYNLRYSQDCVNCNNSFFLRNCTACSDCFGCTNLVQKKYFIFNKQHTREAYGEFMGKIDTGSYKDISEMKVKFDDLCKNIIVKEYQGNNNQNCVGNYLHNNKNCYMGFELDNCEDMRYCQCLMSSKLGMDWTHWGENSEKMYECQACGYDNYNLRFCNLCWSGCSDLTYCDQCFSGKNSFGCVGLKKMRYCILNKQYSEKQYAELTQKIIAHMKRTGEWGEFFPVSKSNYAYNETLAWEQMPLSKDEILERGWIYKDHDSGKKRPGIKYEIPDSIKDVPDDITGQILASEESGDAYKIIPQELKFYRKQNIPIPRLTPDERHFLRMEKRNRRVMYDRTCANCGAAIQTTYAPDHPETIYCEKCYLKAVY